MEHLVVLAVDLHHGQAITKLRKVVLAHRAKEIMVVAVHPITQAGETAVVVAELAEMEQHVV
jgi:hypothetical protein